MKKRLLSLAMMFVVAGTVSATAGGGKKDEVQRKSVTPQNSAPRPFVAAGDNPKTQPAISTGYYIVDSEDNVADYNPTTRSGWRPSPETVSLNFEPALWNRIVSGPYQMPPGYWESNRTEGLRYFRNPANMNDSTDNALAGPIPLRLSQPFYFNGVRYDSFYVSTNGIVALSNRRYFYNPATGERYIPDGATSAYDPNSEDTRARDNSSPQASLTDPTPDNYGYRYIALGMTNETTAETATATSLQGIRNPDNATLANFTNSAPIIAPFWDDLQLSQFNRYTNQVDETPNGQGFGQVWYKRSAAGDRLIIYFINLMPINVKNTPYGTTNFLRDVRPGASDNFVSVNAQVVLNASDSSVHFNYEVFDGIASVGGRPVPSQRIFRDNSTIGLRGQARHVNYGPPAGGETRYNQFSEYLVNGTVYVDGPRGSELTTPNNQLAIRFKQWKNVLRSYGTKYILRNPATNQFDANNKTYVITDPNNFELLAGDPLLGAIQPIAMFQNLSNNIQGPNGINFQQQGLQFRVRFRIKNDIIGPDTLVYNRLLCGDSLTFVDGYTRWDQLTFGARIVDASGNAIPFPGPNNLNGVPPYGFVEVKFPAFESSNFLPNHIGRLTAEVIAEPYRCGGGDYGDQWPFDDTTSARLFGLRRLATMNDDVNDFSVSRREGTLPSVNKWVSINAEAINGDDATYNPPPPRGRQGLGTTKLPSPVIRLNRVTLSGSNPNPLPGGDELRSFPIDLRNKRGAVLSFSYQRTGVPPGGPAGYNRGWRDQTLVGPEPRVVQNTAPPHPDAGVVQAPDELYLEFATPSPDGYKNIVNIPAAEWSKHPRMDNPGQFFNDNAAISIFGGGGLRRGWHEENGDSAISRVDGLRANLYDDGKDFEFKKMFIQIPDTIINSPNEGARNFRFRFRVRAADNTTPANADDNDDFFLDNTRIFFPTESPDLEISSVQVKWPYTMAPSSQSSELPVAVTISNNTSIGASSFAVQVLIKRKDEPEDRYVYCRARTIPFLPAYREVAVDMPTWNGRQTTPGEYILAGRLYTPWGDPNRLNDSTYGEFTLNFGPAYAYDPATPPTGLNNVSEQQFSGQVGKGLNLSGNAEGTNWTAWAYGADAGNNSGQMAMKFRITTQDTIYGYQAYFASLNSDLLNVRFSLYRDQGGSPGQRIATTRTKQRGFDDIRSPLQNPPEPFYNEYTTYTSDPIVLLPGTYWMSVAQMGTEGFELGGSSFRMGQVTTYAGTIIRPGDANISLNAFKGFRRKNITGDLINDNTFAYENSLGSGTWQPFTPTVGNPGYAHLNNLGFVGQLNTYSRGSWIPMIRPYFGNRSFSSPPIYIDSALCAAIVPVELANFDGVVRRGGIDLFWETATEINNAGFHVERRVADADQSWDALTFVGGQGNSTVLNRYGYLDKNVVRGTTYEYRLRQVDFDGSETYSNTIERTYNYAENVVLEQNYPNPFSDKTSIHYAVPDGGYLKLEITDMMGNVVVSIADGYVDAGDHSYEWNGLDASGNRVTAGTYLCKLTQGDQVIVRKMSIIR